MLNYSENRKHFKKLRQGQALPMLFAGLVVVLLTCFLAFAVRFSCIGIVALHKSTIIEKGK